MLLLLSPTAEKTEPFFMEKKEDYSIPKSFAAAFYKLILIRIHENKYEVRTVGVMSI